MRRSQLFIKTRKELPADEEAKNAQLLIKAGYVHKEMAGVYSYLTLGKIVIDKISQIIREEIDDVGGNEVLLSTLQNKDLWEASGRWDDNVVDNWFKTKLVGGTEVGIGFSHEEPLTYTLKHFVNSYKDLPVYPYQIQTKFRNELRAKSGLLRAREFLMKDLYSYSRNQQEHDEFYEKVATSYLKIFKNLGFPENITYRTFASGGSFSRFSDEFQVLSHVGEDTIYIDKAKKIGINKEVLNEENLSHIGLDRQSLSEEKAVEVGNIFSLGTKFSEPLGLSYTDEHGQQQPIIMGCYGIGVSRIMGLIAEHFADERGLIWPANVAPYSVYLIAITDVSKETTESVYNRLTESGVGVIYDDRDASAGEKFADADLMGIPLRLVISDKTLQENACELKARTSDQMQLVKTEDIVKAVEEHLHHLI